MELVARKLHIGKHASFHAEVTIHDLTNVPLVSGKFSCKWRFKNHISVQSAAANSDGSSGGFLHPRSALHISRRARGESESSSDDDSSSHHSSRRASRESARSGVADLMTGPERTVSSTTARANDSGTLQKPEARGHTEPVTLSRHTADWEDRKIFCPVSMSVAKDGELGPCVLKLIIRQTFHNEQGKAEEARLGDVQADLAEFADPQRSPTRRYLLNNSKINALLRITVKLHHTGGARDYHAPPRDRKSHLKDTMKKKAGGSTESLGSKRSKQNSKASKDSKEKHSPDSSLHSKRSADSASRLPRDESHTASDYNVPLGFTAIHAAPGHMRRGSAGHHAPEAIIEQLFKTSLEDMPMPDDLKPRTAESPESPRTPGHHHHHHHAKGRSDSHDILGVVKGVFHHTGPHNHGHGEHSPHLGARPEDAAVAAH